MPKGMTTFVGMLGLSIGLPAFADWQVVKESTRTASTPSEIYSFLTSEEYAWIGSWYANNEMIRRISGYRESIILKITSTSTSFIWTGPNSCNPNDPRQYAVISSGTIQRSRGGGFGWDEGLPGIDPQWDPCAEGALKAVPKRTFSLPQS